VGSPNSRRLPFVPGEPRRPLVTFLPAVVAAYAVVYAAWNVFAPISAAVGFVAGNISSVPVGLTMCVLALRLAGRPAMSSTRRAGWRLLAVAFIFGAIGNISWATAPFGLTTVNLTTVAHVAYVLSYLTAASAALPLIDGPPAGRERVKLALDAAMVVLGGGMLIWHGVVVPQLLAAPAGTGRVLAMVYPACDLFLATCGAVLLLRCPDGARRRPALYVVGSFAVVIARDLVTGIARVTDPVGLSMSREGLTLVFFVLLALAVRAESERLAGSERRGDHTPLHTTLVPYGAVICGYALLLVVAWGGSDGPTFQLLVGSLLLTVLVAVRQVVAVRENLQLQRERDLLSGEARFRSLVQHASDVVSIVDVQGVVSFASPSADGTLGYLPDDLVGTSILALLHAEDAPEAARRLEEVARTGRTATGRWRMQRKDGAWIQTDNICTNLVRDENVRGIVVNTRDISERCTLEAQLLHQAFHDPLTGLANRALFLDRVRHALSRRSHGADGLGILFIDLDGFKTVNDSLGHQVGDLLLRGVSERLASGLRSFDTIARLGGDEFAVLIDDADGDDGVIVIADRVGQTLREPFLLEGREVVTLASIGVALATPEESAEDLLRNADLAMYLAKNKGGGQAALFEPEMHAAMLNRLELQADLRRALERNEFSLAYQPVHALETQALVGVEALLRWAHPTRGSVPPNEFIPIAEQTGLIVPIGRWVIEQACRDAREWRTQLGGVAPQSVAVNISGRQIPDPSLFDDIQDALSRSELPPSALMLELTESVLLTHTDETLSVMHRLKAIGVGLALDDFGTGYSSLSYLQRLPIDVIKIDRAFVERLETDASASALTRAIVGLGKTLSLRTVAEGIENPTQADVLRHMGCDHGQGFLYGMPMPARELQHYASRVGKFVAA
jgi:diguanylate cyclase (GGDEF)-like protein/PAS domain S-box-containing protein